MKKIINNILVLVLLLIPITAKAIATNSSYNNIKVYLFYEDDCRDCDKAKEWLENELKDNVRVRAEYLNISDNVGLYEKVRGFLDVKKKNTPLIVIGTNFFDGFDEKIQNSFKDAIKAYEEVDGYCDAVVKLQYNEDTNNCLEQNKDIYVVKEFPIALVIGISAGVLVIAIALCTFIIIKKKRKKADKK